MWHKLKDMVKTSKNGVVRRISIKRTPVRSLARQGRLNSAQSPVNSGACTDEWQLLAEVYNLAVDDDSQRWERLTEGLIPVVVNCVQESPKHIFHIVGTSYPMGRVLDLQISVPGTKLLKSGDCFVQWRDTVQGGVWGLNFVSEADAYCFVKACTPSNRPPLHHTNSSVSLPLEPPPGVQLPPSPEDSGGYITDIDQLIAEDNDVFTSTPKENSSHGQSLSFENEALEKDSLLQANCKEHVRELGDAHTPGSSHSVFSVYENVEESELPKAPPRRKKSFAGSKIIKESLENESVDVPGAAFIDVGDKHNLYEPLDNLPPPPPCVMETGRVKNGSLGRNTKLGSLINNSPGSVRSRSNTDSHLHRSNSGIALPLIPKELPDSLPPRRSSLPRQAKSMSYYDNSFVGEPIEMSTPQPALKEYELHLQKMNLDYSDSGFGNGMCPETETATSSTKSSKNSESSGRGKSKPTSGIVRIMGGGSDSGSSVGRHSNGTNRRSSSTAEADSVDTSELKPFMFKEEDDVMSDASNDSLSSHKSDMSYNRRGAIRKAGWLHVKNMLVTRKKKVERAAKRRWKKYWVCLKGTTLLFFVCDEKTSVDESSTPRHVLVADGAISQAVPEHPKRDHIFCLSTSFGDAYLFQAQSQIEMENWMGAIHSACSSALARQHGKEDTLKLLKSEAQKLEQQIDVDGKMKKMAELQLTVVSDPRSKHAIVKQIAQWEQNLEQLFMELYRLRCYMASLQGTELPNPKTLLSNVSKPTKNALGRLGYFSASSFHAMVCSRSTTPSLTGLYGKPKKKKTMDKFECGVSTLKGNVRSNVRPPIRIPDWDEVEVQKNNCSLNTTGASDLSFDDEEPMVVAEGTAVWENLGEGMLTKVTLPDNQSTVVKIRPGMLVQDVLYTCCIKRQMDYLYYYISLRKSSGDGTKQYVPDRYVFMDKQEYDEVEVLPKSIHQVELYKYNDDPTMTFGFQIEAELGEDSEQEDQLCVFISEIHSGSLAYHQDLQIGDELLVINGKVVCDLDMLYIEQVIQQETALTLTVRSCRKVYIQSEIAKETDQYIDQLTCPPPPTQFRISDDLIDDLIVPAPSEYDDSRTMSPKRSSSGIPLPTLTPDKEFPELSNEQIDSLLQNAEQVTAFCRQLNIRDFDCKETNSFKDFDDQHETTVKHMSTAQKIRKVILELLDTERSYVKDLNCLMLRYLEPLQNEAFLTVEELDALFGNIKDIVSFQETFLHSLEEAIQLEPNFYDIETPIQFRRILFSIGGSFLFYVDHFKLYSTFCASHSKAQKILDPARGNKCLREFLEARNPKHQHSSSLSSYLIKPIQRVLKYPLLLRELKSHTDPENDEHYHLSEALKGMEKVAEHINDMMKVHEEYGDIFENLIQDQYHLKREVPDLAMDDLVMYGAATWFNCQEDLGKVKKGMEPEVIVFVFRLAVVLICKERVRKKSKLSSSLYSPSLRGSTTSNFVGDVIIRFKRLIPVASLQVRNSTTNDTDYRCMWELLQTKSTTEGRPEKVFVLSCNTTEDKNSFLKSIRQILRDYNRYKNSTPTTNVKQPIGKPKTYTPYGGKRFEGLNKGRRLGRRRPFSTPQTHKKSEDKEKAVENESSIKTEPSAENNCERTAQENIEKTTQEIIESHSHNHVENTPQDSVLNNVPGNDDVDNLVSHSVENTAPDSIANNSHSYVGKTVQHSIERSTREIIENNLHDHVENCVPQIVENATHGSIDPDEQKQSEPDVQTSHEIFFVNSSENSPQDNFEQVVSSNSEYIAQNSPPIIRNSWAGPTTKSVSNHVPYANEWTSESSSRLILSDSSSNPRTTNVTLSSFLPTRNIGQKPNSSKPSVTLPGSHDEQYDNITVQSVNQRMDFINSNDPIYSDMIIVEDEQIFRQDHAAVKKTTQTPIRCEPPRYNYRTENSFVDLILEEDQTEC